MNKNDFNAVLEIALLKNDGMTELEIRQLLARMCSNEVIQAGLNLCDFLNRIEVKQ